MAYPGISGVSERSALGLGVGCADSPYSVNSLAYPGHEVILSFCVSVSFLRCFDILVFYRGKIYPIEIKDILWG